MNISRRQPSSPPIPKSLVEFGSQNGLNIDQHIYHKSISASSASSALIMETLVTQSCRSLYIPCFVLTDYPVLFSTRFTPSLMRTQKQPAEKCEQHFGKQMHARRSVDTDKNIYHKSISASSASSALIMETLVTQSCRSLYIRCFVLTDYPILLSTQFTPSLMRTKKTACKEM